MLLIENPVNASPLIFPVLECIHLLGIAVAIGTIAIVDFRILGFGLIGRKAVELSNATALFTAAALIVVIFTGMLLFSSDPDMYYLNPSFLLKMVFLLSAILFNYTIRRKVLATLASEGPGKLVACVSLALWMCVIFGGMFIGFTNPIQGI